jgi:FkbM family methyltransferase
MIKQLLKNNKIAQRAKAIKDLFLEKLDTLNLKSDQQLGSIDRLSDHLLEARKASDSNINTLQNNVNALLENGAFLLKFSIDVVNGLQRVIEESKQQQQTAQQIYQSIGDSYKTVEQIHQEFQKIRDEAQRYNQSVMQKLIEVQEEDRVQNISTEKILNQVYADIHNQKFKVVTDQAYFQDIDIGLMLYLYSFLPNHRAIDIGANRGDISSRLLETGYEVYAFEPFPPVLAVLQERLGKNTNFHSFPFALGSANETRDLNLAVDQTEDKIYDDATFYSSLTRHSLAEGLIFSETIPVTVKTLASLHDSNEIPSDIGLVKIDTEGFDLEVIKGMGDFRYPVVVAEFWDPTFPFGRTGAMNYLKDMVRAMKERDYRWHIVVYRIWGSHDVSYYCNSDYSLDNSWGNVFFFQDYEVFNHALRWCSSVMPATYFSV